MFVKRCISSPALRLFAFLLALFVLVGSLAYTTPQFQSYVRNGFFWTPMKLVAPTDCVQKYREDGIVRLTPYVTLLYGAQEIAVEIAKTDAERRRGLSGRECIQQGQGMLFVFDETDYHMFWMNEMRFPIDMVWINDGIVVYTAPNVPPPSETGGVPVSRAPPRQGLGANIVLELAAGEVKRLGITPRSSIKLTTER